MAPETILAGPRHESGRKLLDERPSRRSERDASMPPSIPIHKVSCCTTTADPGIPFQRNVRDTISITGRTVINDSARIEKTSSKNCSGVLRTGVSGAGAATLTALPSSWRKDELYDIRRGGALLHRKDPAAPWFLAAWARW